MNEAAVKGNGVVGKALSVVGELLSNKGGYKKGVSKAAKDISKRESKNIDDIAEQLIKNKGGAESVGEEGVKKIKNEAEALAHKTNADYAGAATSKDDILLSQAATNKMVGGEAGISQGAYDDSLKSLKGEANRKGAFNATKDYYADPFKRMGDKTLSEAERSLAMKQFVARGAATAGGVGITAGLTHDLFSNKEDDTGLGGIAVNTAAMTGVGAAATAGIGLLRKL